MTQRIKIPVEAQTSGAEDAIRRLDRTAEQAGSSVAGIASGAAAAAKSIDDAAAATERLARAQAILSRENGRPISRGDTQTFLDNFERMRNGRGLGARRVRSFDNFENWYQGHQSSFTRSSTAEQHRRAVIAAGMQGTGDARQYGAPPEPPPPGGGGGGGGGGGMGPLAQRAGSSAWGFLKGGLALAGIGGIVSTLASGVGKAAEEAIGIDSLKRQMGDLGVDFEGLRTRVRSTGEGLGVAYSEAQQLAGAFARERGAANMGDLRSVRTGIGFGRSYGLAPEQGVSFFGRMGRLGVANDDTAARKLGLTVADAIEKGGYTAKADEVLAAISNYTEQTARLTLSAPNVGSYSSYLTSLMATGRPGLDPSGAASILSAADSSVRRGGAMGDASLNFSLAALLRGNSGMDPITAKALMEGGLFGTTNSVFGSGSPLGGWYGARGLQTPQLNDTTNFERMMPMLRQQYGNTPSLLEAIQNHFGLESLSQASALEGMTPTDLSSSRRLVEGAGLDFSKLSATGFEGIAAIASARTGGEVADRYSQVMNRTDVTEEERRRLADAMGESVRTGNVEALKTALVAVVGTKEQEQTEGQQTRESIASVESAITAVGSSLLTPLNLIRNAVDAIATFISPAYREAQEVAAAEARGAEFEQGRPSGIESAMSDFRSNVDQNSPTSRDFMARSIEYARRAREARAGANGATVDPDSIIRAPDPADRNSRFRAKRDAYWADRVHRRSVEHILSPDTVGTTPEDDNMRALRAMPGEGADPRLAASRAEGEVASMQQFMAAGFSREAAAGIVGNTSHESGGFSGARGDGGRARGAAQWHPDRWNKMVAWARAQGKNPNLLSTQNAYIIHEMDTADGGNIGRRMRSGRLSAVQSARLFADGFERPAREADGDPHGWAQRSAIAARLAGSELPAGSGGSGEGGGNMTFQFAPAIVTLQDSRGQVRGSTTLNPFPQAAAPAGQ